MRNALGTRAQALIALALVAAFGALAGIAGDRLVSGRAATQDLAGDSLQEFRGPGFGPGRGIGRGAPGMPGVRPGGGMGPGAGAGPGPGGGPMDGRGQIRYGERLGALLDLSGAQRTAIDSILSEERHRVRQLNDEFEPRFRAIAEQTRRRVEEVLTEEQRNELQSLRRERLRSLQGDTAGGPRM